MSLLLPLGYVDMSCSRRARVPYQYRGRGGSAILSLFLEGRGVGFFRYKTKFLGVGGWDFLPTFPTPFSSPPPLYDVAVEGAEPRPTPE